MAICVDKENNELKKTLMDNELRRDGTIKTGKWIEKINKPGAFYLVGRKDGRRLYMSQQVWLTGNCEDKNDPGSFDWGEEMAQNKGRRSMRVSIYIIIDQPRKDKGRSRTSLIDQEKFNNASSTYTLQQLS